MTDPVAFFRSVAARHPRCFWLDGGGAREWSGRRSIIGWLDEDDASLSWSAARREVTLHAGGVATVVGDDVFAVLEQRDRGGGAVVRLPRLRLAHRPPRHPRPDASPTPCGCGRARCGCSSTRSVRRPRRSPVDRGSLTVRPCNGRQRAGRAATARTSTRSRASRSTCTPATPTRSTSPTALTRESDLDPVTAYLRLRELNPAPYAGFLQHDVDGAPRVAAVELAGAVRPRHRRPAPGDQADQGHHPARRDRRGGRAPPRAARARPEDPRGEPDDRRPAPQRPVGGRARSGRSRCRS